MKTYRPFMNLARNDRQRYSDLLAIAEGDKKRMRKLCEVNKKNPFSVDILLSLARHTSTDAYDLYRLIIKQNSEEKKEKGLMDAHEGKYTKKMLELDKDSLNNIKKRRELGVAA